MQIQISWLLQKPTDLDLHCLQRQCISGFSRPRVNSFCAFHPQRAWYQIIPLFVVVYFVTITQHSTHKMYIMLCLICLHHSSRGNGAKFFSFRPLYQKGLDGQEDKQEVSNILSLVKKGENLPSLYSPC